MKVSILKTDGGEHSPEQWAFATANRLVEVDPSAIDDRFLKAQELQLAVTKVLIKHHTEVQETEHAALTANGDAHHDTPIDVEAHVDAALAEVVDAAKGSPWEAQFQDADMQAKIRQLLWGDFHTSKQIKRDWHKIRAGQGA